MKCFSKKGFTLAEVLITLGIIGIVAEITIPTLYHGFMDQNFKVAYKKSYSVFSQAMLRGYSESNINPYSDVAGKLANFNAFKSYFKVAKDCPTTNSDCWSINGEKYGGTYPSSDALAFIDASGMAWTLADNTIGTGRYLVDTNGSKGPNKYGQDRFPFSYDASTGRAFVFPCDYINITDTCAALGNTPATASCPSAASHPCYYQSWITGGN